MGNLDPTTIYYFRPTITIVIIVIITNVSEGVYYWL